MNFEISEEDARLIIHYLKISQSSQFGTCKRLAEALIAQLPPAPPVVSLVAATMTGIGKSMNGNCRGSFVDLPLAPLRGERR